MPRYSSVRKVHIVVQAAQKKQAIDFIRQQLKESIANVKATTKNRNRKHKHVKQVTCGDVSTEGTVRITVKTTLGNAKDIIASCQSHLIGNAHSELIAAAVASNPVVVQATRPPQQATARSTDELPANLLFMSPAEIQQYFEGDQDFVIPAHDMVLIPVDQLLTPPGDVDEPTEDGPDPDFDHMLMEEMGFDFDKD